MNQYKKFNIFILMTTISKSMIELFIPIILFNKGLNFKEILFFYLLKFSFLFIIENIIKLFKINNKTLIYLSSIVSIITYLILYLYKSSFLHLIIISFLYSLYLSSYWIYRHNIALSIIEDKKATDRSSIFMIITLIGLIPSSLLGGYVINKFDFIHLIIIVTILTFISLFFIIDIKNEKVKKRRIKYPFKNRLFLFLEQFKFITISLFPLFAYNQISNNYFYIGLLNTLTAVSSIIYIYILAKFMDKNKKDYLNIMCTFLGITWAFKLIFLNKYIFLLITLFEGVFKYALDTIILRNIYSFGKNFNQLNYNVYIENIRNLSRIVILIIFLLFNINLNIIIITSIVCLFISSFIKFDDGDAGYSKLKKT